MDMDLLLAGLRAAAEPSRLRLLVLCARAELTVSDLTQILGQSQPRVSRHLKVLCEAGLLDRSREGTWAFYRLAQRGPGADLARTLVGLISVEGGAGKGVAARDLERLEEVKRARAAAAAEYFRANAARWDQIRSLHADETEVERVLLRLLPKGEIADLLDVGTGTGRVLEVLADRIETGVGIDLSREMLAVARARLERAERHNCSLRHGDMYQLPWEADSFDAVTIHQVLHFADDPARSIGEAARVLRPGGRMVVVDFAPHDLTRLRDEHAHLRLGFSDDEVAEWLREAGLEPGQIIHLPGGSLTVTVWLGVRTGPPQAVRRGRAQRLSAATAS